MDDASLVKHLDDSKSRMAAFTAKIKIQHKIEALTETHLASLRLLLDEQNGALSELQELSACRMKKHHDGVLQSEIPSSRLKDAAQAVNDCVDMFGSAINKLTALLQENGAETERSNGAANADQSGDADAQPG